jgi:hypothetical protein
MTAHLPVRDNRPNDELHPLIYQSLIGLTIWFVLSVWALFSRGAYEGLTLSVGIPVLLWLTWRRNIDPNEQHNHTAPFGEWISRPFVTWTGGISGREAAVQILLPIGAGPSA